MCACFISSFHIYFKLPTSIHKISSGALLNHKVANQSNQSQKHLYISMFHTIIFMAITLASTSIVESALMQLPKTLTKAEVESITESLNKLSLSEDSDQVTSVTQVYDPKATYCAYYQVANGQFQREDIESACETFENETNLSNKS